MPVEVLGVGCERGGGVSVRGDGVGGGGWECVEEEENEGGCDGDVGDGCVCEGEVGV